MKHKVDLNSWDKKEQFLLFKNFDEPFHGVCIRIDCTNAYKRSKELGASFFLYYLHKCTMAVNSIEAFRYRIEGNDVFYTIASISNQLLTVLTDLSVLYDAISRRFSEISGRCSSENGRGKTEYRSCPGLEANAIHYSAVPWVDFTSLSHATNFTHNSAGCPKISFGKMTEVNGIKSMPVSIHVHHGFIDGRQLEHLSTSFND